MKNPIQANNYDQAAKELEAIENGLSKKISSQIEGVDNGHFTVALVRSQNNEITKKYDHKVSVQQLNTRAFEKMENNLAVTGFDKMIIVHNPDPSHKRNTKTVQFVPQSATQANAIESPAQMEARLRAEYEQKYAGFVPATQAGAIDTTAAGTTVNTAEEIEKRLRAEFELKFGPDTDPEVIKTDEFIAVTQDGATLKIFANNPDVIVDDAENTEVKMVGDFNDETSVPNLKKFAADNNIDLKGITVKEKILEKLNAWKSENVK